MKRYLYLIITVLMLASCKTSKDYLAKSNDDNTIFDAVKMLKKHPGDTMALVALPVLYNLAQQRNIRKVKSYEASKDLSRWDKILDRYTTLQNMYDAIIDVDAAYRTVTPASYQGEILETKNKAAADYYEQALILLDNNNRQDFKLAYNYLKKVNGWVPNYRDTRDKMNQAFERSIVNVVVNPVQDNSFFMNTGLGIYGFNYSKEYFQQTLVRELDAVNRTRYPARFYSDWEARRNDVNPDWIVDLSLRNLYIPRPQSNTYNRNVSKRIETGRDTSGKIIYQTVYATLHITRKYFTANGEMEVNIHEAGSNKTIRREIFRDDYNWQEEQATYSGDSRALGPNEWSYINNNYFNEPRREDVLNELYRQLYPRVKNSILYAADW